jgi:hypothetical protein
MSHGEIEARREAEASDAEARVMKMPNGGRKLI